MAKTCSACGASASAACTVCNTALCSTHVHQGQPFISAGQLVATTATTAFRAPAMLGDLLFKEMELVPYCESCREELAGKRTGEQLKFLLGILLIMALVIGLPAYMLFVG